MAMPPIPHTDYPNSAWMFNHSSPFLQFVRRFAKGERPCCSPPLNQIRDCYRNVFCLNHNCRTCGHCCSGTYTHPEIDETTLDCVLLAPRKSGHQARPLLQSSFHLAKSGFLNSGCAVLSTIASIFPSSMRFGLKSALSERRSSYSGSSIVTIAPGTSKVVAQGYCGAVGVFRHLGPERQPQEYERGGQ